MRLLNLGHRSCRIADSSDLYRASGSNSGSTSRDVSPVSSHALVRSDDILSARRLSRCPSPDNVGVTDEQASDWRTYEQYVFENLVMSGGGSKCYAYIGALKVTTVTLYIFVADIHVIQTQLGPYFVLQGPTARKAMVLTVDQPTIKCHFGSV
jgi:hypothetical protein